MNSEIQNALSSGAEVAAFAWSLLELLLTRILPLVGFLAGHMILQCGALLSALVIPTASRRHKLPAQYYSWDEHYAVKDVEDYNVQPVAEDEQSWDAPQVEELAEEEEKVKIVKEEEDDDHDHRNVSESLKIAGKEQEISPHTPKEEVSGLEDEKLEAASTAADGALRKSTSLEGAVTESHRTGDGANQARGSEHENVAKSVLSDVQRAENCTSDMVDLGSSHVVEAGKQIDFDVAGEEEKHVPSKAASNMDLEPSDSQTSKEASKTTSEEGPEMRKSSSSRGPKSSILRVLAASRSQMNRNLRQRSHRVTFSL